MRLSRVVFRDPMQDPDSKDGPDYRPDVFTDQSHELTLADSLVTIRSRETGRRVVCHVSGIRYARVIEEAERTDETIVLESFDVHEFGEAAAKLLDSRYGLSGISDDDRLAVAFEEPKVMPLTFVAEKLEEKLEQLDNAETRILDFPGHETVVRDVPAKKGKAK